MKGVEDALALRNTILTNFEKALQIKDELQLNSLMDFVIVGGGPTGVELAGALSELRKHVFPKDYPELNFVNMDIHLIQSGPQLLKGMSDEAAYEAKQILERAGVKLWLNCRVKSYNGFKVQLDTGESLCTRTLIWAAGVTATSLEGLDSAVLTSGNRLKVDSFSRVEGYSNIFAIGDIAAMVTNDSPDGYAMMAQPAMQQGRWLGQNIKRLLQKKDLSHSVIKIRVLWRRSAGIRPWLILKYLARHIRPRVSGHGLSGCLFISYPSLVSGTSSWYLSTGCGHISPMIQA
jgi:NADH dehydrogenase